MEKDSAHPRRRSSAGPFEKGTRIALRMRIRYPTIAATLLPISFLLLSTSHLFAQGSGSTRPTSSSIVLGLGAHYSSSIAFGEFPIFRGSADCGLFGDGREQARGLSAELRLPESIGKGFGIAARANVATGAETFTGYPINPQTVRDPLTNNTVELDREFRFRLSSTSVVLDMLVSSGIGPRLTLTAGPSIGYRVSGTFEQFDTVLGPGGFLFEDGATRHVMLEGIPFTLRPFMVGGVAGAGYRFPVGKHLNLEPRVSVRFDLVGPVREMKRSTLGAGLGLSITYDLRRAGWEEQGQKSTVLADAYAPSGVDVPVDEAELPRTSPPDVPAAAEPLRSSLDVYSVDASSVRSDTAVIAMHSVRERRFVSLLPRLYFERNESEIPDRYPRLVPEETFFFEIDSLPGADPERIGRHILDIVGRRLSDNPGTSVTLSGSVSIDEPNDLVADRVASVASYLQEVWGIGKDRIRLGRPQSIHDPVDNGTEEGREEQRYVAIDLTPADLIAPVIVEQAVREFTPPGIKLAPDVESDAGLEEWEIVIRQGGTEVARYTNDGSRDASAGIPWNVVAGEGDAPAELIAELTATDKAGRTGSASDTLPVLFVNDETVDPSGERLQFVLPGSWGETVSKEWVRQEARKITARLRGGERVRIYPRYNGADRFATERSLALAKALGESVIEELERSRIDVADVVIGKLPEDWELSGADTPERRVTQRGVVVVVE